MGRQPGPEIYARTGIISVGTLLCALLLSIASISAPPAVATESDTREVFGPGSPAWLRAVGRLQVPASRYWDGRTEHHLEDCSATLVSVPGRRSANTVVTAWHCLEFYRDLSRPINFSAQDGDGQWHSRQAYRLADGGGMPLLGGGGTDLAADAGGVERLPPRE